MFAKEVFFLDFKFMDRFFAVLILLFFGGCRSISSTEKDFSAVLKQVEDLNAQGHYIEAVALLKENDPYTHLDLLEALAFSYEANGKILLSAQTFEQLFFADTEKKYTESAFYAAQIYAQLGCLYAASQCYRLYIDTHFKEAELWFALADIEEKLDHGSLALRAYLNGIQICNEKTSHQLFQLSRLCYKNEMWDGAAFWAQEYLKISENNVDVLQVLLDVADKHNDRQKVKFYLAELQKLEADYLEKHPDIKLKYIEEEIPDQDIPIENFPHDIHSTQEEIEYTVTCFPIFDKSLKLQIPQPLKLPNCLCLPCTY